MTTRKVTPAETLMYRLAANGVDYLFINSGTDYPPLIEGIAKCQALGAKGGKIPQLVICPHENAAMGMADGYHFATGKAQAVSLHTNVGLANSVTQLINQACNNVPTLLFSGKTPMTERDHFGCIDTPIGYGQEMRDQAALVRESVKCDFDLREPDQMADHINRAYAIANSEPKGPVYMALTRETLCVEYEADEDELHAPTNLQPTAYAPVKEQVTLAADLISKAKHPVILAQRGARSAEGFDLLSKLANRWGIPVVECWATEVGISSEDPMFAGGDAKPWVEQADVIVIIDSLAPYMISKMTPPAGCQFIQVGPDPLFTRYPVRDYSIDVSLAGDTAVCLEALLEELDGKSTADQEVISKRVAEVAAVNAKNKEERQKIAAAGCQARVSKEFLSQTVGNFVEKHNGTLISELAIAREYTGLTRYNSFYQEALAGGLGGAFPIALGVQLADREKLVVLAVGDGCYLFSNPAVCHQIAEAMKLPVLVVVANNGAWGAVEHSVEALYPNGYAAKAKEMPAVELTPSPDFTKIAEASGGLGLHVTHGKDLEAALEKAADFIKKEKRVALINVDYQ